MLEVSTKLGEKYKPKKELAKISGVFQVSSMSTQERADMRRLLRKFREGDRDIKEDLEKLVTITAEIKAINNQAVILHGERIKRAQTLLKDYKEGAFTTWMLKTYGNRQTPYNFLQYYEFHDTLPSNLRSVMNEMPRQAIYTLSSRDVPQEQKEEFIEGYQGETKGQLLSKLRKTFPLPKEDKRSNNNTPSVISSLTSLVELVRKEEFSPSPLEKKQIGKLLKHLYSLNKKAKSS